MAEMTKPFLFRKVTKMYYEYDKQIKSANKDIQALTAEIAALQGVNTAEAKALVKQKQAQLQEAQDNLKDLQQEHIFDIQLKALDDYIDRLEDDIKDQTKTIEETFEEYMEKVQEALNMSKDTDVQGALTRILRLIMGDTASAILEEINWTDTTIPDVLKLISENAKALENGHMASIQPYYDNEEPTAHIFPYYEDSEGTASIHSVIEDGFSDLNYTITSLIQSGTYKSIADSSSNQLLSGLMSAINNPAIYSDAYANLSKQNISADNDMTGRMFDYLKDKLDIPLSSLRDAMLNRDGISQSTPREISYNTLRDLGYTLTYH